MTDTELTLFKEIIRETVKTAIKEEREAMKKDLKEIKLLVAGVLKESKNANKQPSVYNRGYAGTSNVIPEEKRSQLSALIGSDFPKPISQKAKALMNNPDIMAAPVAMRDVLLETASQIYSGQDMNGMQDLLPGEKIE